MKKIIALSIVALLCGCATLNSGADPLVVRVEQTLQGANATFDFVLNVDNLNRSFWITNAPALHNFCEWLRTPQTYGTNTVARCVAMQLNVDDLKLTYKFSKTTGSSNALWSAWSVLNAAVEQTVSWSNIITSPVHP